MSGFAYHVRCAACGLTGPTIPFGRLPWDPPELHLPAANLVSHELEVATLGSDDETARVPLVERARRHATETFRVAAPVLETDRIALMPPLPCPRCGEVIETATWGGRPPTEHATASLEDMIAKKVADSYELALVVDLDLTSSSKALLGALAHPPWPAVSAWRAPYEEDDEPARTAPLDPFLARTVVRSIEWRHGSAIHVLGSMRDGRTMLDILLRDTEPEHGWRWLVACEEVVTRLLDGNVPVARARLTWRGDGVHCIPDLPQIGGPTYLFAGTDDVLALGWDDIDAMIAAGGWDARLINGRRLLTRAMHAETNVELLEAIQDGQWAMARLTKPKTCRYRLDDPEPEEVPIFAAGEPRLLAVGYDAAVQTAIYSCALDEGQHVQPREVWTLGRALRDHELPSGEPVRAIRVIFADRPSALRERRPLLDLGVTVQCYGPSGELETLPEDR